MREGCFCVCNPMTEELKPIPPIVISEVLLQENRNLELLKSALQETLVKVFGENEDAQKFIDVSRIPLICQNIHAMHDNIKDIKENMHSNNKDHEMRIRGIEKNQWKVAGAIIVLSPLVTIGIAWIISIITRH